ncbi:MAG: Gfo/Idh/MocA family oxidoreductase [Planctomycetes bacterium]|nr:Gfo/Idh/MocA family oxidoreductase [Planctomycetota bacterium]
MGKVHTYGYRNIPLFYDPPPCETKLVGVCTAHEETAEKARKVGGFDFCTTDPNELLQREDIQIINCCTPNRLHKDLLLAAIDAGKHIYCDKPLAFDADEAREIAAAAEKGPGKYQVTLQYRFLPATLRAKQMIEEGFLGRVFGFRAQYLHAGYIDPARPMSWRLKKAESGGGALFDLGSHILDLIYHLLGDYESVSALCETMIKERPLKGDPATMEPVEVDDITLMTVRMKSGAVGTVESWRLATGTNDEMRFEIHGEMGALRFNLMEPNWLYAFDVRDPEGDYGGRRGFKQIECVQRYPKPAVLPAPKVSVGWIRGHVACLHDFLTHVAEDTPTCPDFSDGARIHEVMDAACRSSEAGRWVEC